MSHRSSFVAATVLAVVACAHTKPPSPPPGPPRRPHEPELPSYRFLASGSRAVYVTALERGAVGVIERASRSVVSTDGLVEKAGTVAPSSLMGGVRVPARLGGGFVFWSDSVLYRARSFIAPLEPVAPLPTNAIDVTFGPSALLVIEPWGGRKAFDLNRAQRVPLSPHGVVDIVTGDDERAVAIDASGRALASTDSGKTWSDVTAELGGRPGRPYAASTVVGFEFSKKEGVWLGADGAMTRGPLPDLHPAGTVGSGLQEAMFALIAGAPLPAGRALVGRGPELRTVDLRTGAVLSTRQVAPGLSCGVLSADEEGLAICYEYGAKKSSVTIVSHALGLTPRKEKTFEGALRPVYGAGVLVVGAGCDGAPSPSLACARRPGGTWTQYDAQPAVDATANPPAPGPMAAFLQPIPVAWVPREDGGVTALAIKRPMKPGEKFRVARFDPKGGSPAFLDKDIAALEHYKWIVGRDGTLRGFGLTSSIAVDARGHVETGAREFKSLAAADPLHALATDEARRLWQSTDGGAHWIEVARPPGPADAPEPLGVQRIQCSLVGCVLPATGGSWLRTGWPEESPSRGQGAAAGARDTVPAASGAGSVHPKPDEVVASALPASPPRPVLSRMRCTQPSEPRVLKAPAAQPPHKGETWRTVFGGRRVLERSGDRAFVSLAYRDEYTGAGDTIGPQSIGHGLRAVARFPSSVRSSVDVARLIEGRAAVEALYVEPFDPAGVILHATSAFATRAQRAAPKETGKEGGPEPTYVNEDDEPGARPVLSSRPGHADGVLLTGSVPAWVDHAGAMHPLVAMRGCSVYGGYTDAHGKLLVACESSAGGARVIEGETGVVRFRLPDVLPFFPLLGSRSSNFPGIPMHVFADPDAIAIAPDGSVGILRLPSGVEPSTEDDPALLLMPGALPIELSPWSKIEMASSPACTSDPAGYRALIQTGVPWVTMEGAPGFHFRTPGMSAIVRWGKDRVCLESIEVGYENIEDASSPTYGMKVMAVARFVGAGAGAGLVGTGRDATVRQAVTCTLE